MENENDPVTSGDDEEEGGSMSTDCSSSSRIGGCIPRLIGFRCGCRCGCCMWGRLEGRADCERGRERAPARTGACDAAEAACRNRSIARSRWRLCTRFNRAKRETSSRSAAVRTRRSSRFSTPSRRSSGAMRSRPIAARNWRSIAMFAPTAAAAAAAGRDCSAAVV